MTDRGQRLDNFFADESKSAVNAQEDRMEALDHAVTDLSWNDAWGVDKKFDFKVEKGASFSSSFSETVFKKGFGDLSKDQQSFINNVVLKMEKAYGINAYKIQAGTQFDCDFSTMKFTYKFGDKAFTGDLNVPMYLTRNREAITQFKADLGEELMTAEARSLIGGNVTSFEEAVGKLGHVRALTDVLQRLGVGISMDDRVAAFKEWNWEGEFIPNVNEEIESYFKDYKGLTGDSLVQAITANKIDADNIDGTYKNKGTEAQNEAIIEVIKNSILNSRPVEPLPEPELEASEEVEPVEGDPETEVEATEEDVAETYDFDSVQYGIGVSWLQLSSVLRGENAKLNRNLIGTDVFDNMTLRTSNFKAVAEDPNYSGELVLEDVDGNSITLTVVPNSKPMNADEAVHINYNDFSHVKVSYEGSDIQDFDNPMGALSHLYAELYVKANHADKGIPDELRSNLAYTISNSDLLAINTAITAIENYVPEEIVEEIDEARAVNDAVEEAIVLAQEKKTIAAINAVEVNSEDIEALTKVVNIFTDDIAEAAKDPEWNLSAKVLVEMNAKLVELHTALNQTTLTEIARKPFVDKVLEAIVLAQPTLSLIDREDGYIAYKVNKSRFDLMNERGKLQILWTRNFKVAFENSVFRNSWYKDVKYEIEGGGVSIFKTGVKPAIFVNLKYKGEKRRIRVVLHENAKINDQNLSISGSDNMNTYLIDGVANRNFDSINSAVYYVLEDLTGVSIKESNRRVKESMEAASTDAE